MSDSEDARDIMTDKLEVRHIWEAITALLHYCQDNDWAGYDPYDALNSRVFSKFPLAHNKFCRIVFTQLMKRNPINLRPLFGIPKGQNPKALALFAMALLKF